MNNFKLPIENWNFVCYYIKNLGEIMSNQENIIVFMGPTLVGKSTIAKRLALLLNENFVNTDTLCLNHSYHEDDAIELFDDLKDYVNAKQAKVIEIGSNTIETCTKEELDYLIKVLTINGKLPTFYLVLPHKNNNASFKFLYNMAKSLDLHKDSSVIDSLNDSLTTPCLNYLNPTIIETLADFKQPSLNKLKRYPKHLEKIAKDIYLSLQINNNVTV